MKKIKIFFKTTVLGGIIVVLPVVITAFVLKWLFELITGLIHPLTQMVVEKSNIQKTLADIVVILLIIGVCFIIGTIVLVCGLGISILDHNFLAHRGTFECGSIFFTIGAVILAILYKLDSKHFI